MDRRDALCRKGPVPELIRERVEMETTDGKTRAAMAETDSGARSTTFVVVTNDGLESKSELPFARFPAMPPTAPAINAIPTASPTLTRAPRFLPLRIRVPLSGKGAALDGR